MINIEDELKKAYESPLFNEVKKLEEDRKRILESALGSSSLEHSVNDMQKVLKSTGFQDAFKTVEDYKKYTQPILEDIEKNDYEALQKELVKSYEPFLKPDISTTLKSLGIAKDSLSRIAEQAAGLNDYSSSISQALKDIARNNDVMDASKRLTSSLRTLDTDMLHHKMDELDHRRLEIKNLPSIDIPRNPVVEQNKRIIEQLDIQNEALTSIGSYISSQNKKLDIQNEIVKEQIEENKSSANRALWIAVISVIISIISTFGAMWVSYDVYGKENKSNDLQHKEVIQQIKDNDTSNLSTKQIQVLNSIMRTLQQQNSNYDKLYKKIENERKEN